MTLALSHSSTYKNLTTRQTRLGIIFGHIIHFVHMFSLGAWLYNNTRVDTFAVPSVLIYVTLPSVLIYVTLRCCAQAIYITNNCTFNIGPPLHKI
jgi:hypothetical protein